MKNNLSFLEPLPKTKFSVTWSGKQSENVKISSSHASIGAYIQNSDFQAVK